eukprot:CAMPEP_0175041676 /NCGR_PEP_ID=MMETSP0052_2-20121109/2074_1 /TAXON_ID=51329 ORGANISM="Polytomella parva, Strain SAG 63-3" /NCGR_SAMPLE_ID=MMETSP0052_2 /ASSEMBLY_ACC=CAM_ASM_000194 /LENGTH=77 /DNA_ID=CAMNT_0016304271 /DNA_START=649 /DNA_END=882 /DNA_ORIENTATION=-
MTSTSFPSFPFDAEVGGIWTEVRHAACISRGSGILASLELIASWLPLLAVVSNAHKRMFGAPTTCSTFRHTSTVSAE